MEANVRDACANEHLHCGCSSPWSPPLHGPFGGTKGDDGVGGVLPHDGVGVSSHMVGDDLARGHIVVLQLFLVIAGE